VLVTGASGGVGEAIGAELAAEYTVLGLANRHPLGGRFRALPHVRDICADLTSPTWADNGLRAPFLDS
jgi:nucleoside-diphosphate-sugar epimerase